MRTQAVAEARGAAAAQEAWLKANMGAHFSRKLLGVVKRIERHMGPHDSDASHQFPRLAGSYLSEVGHPLVRNQFLYGPESSCTLQQLQELNIMGLPPPMSPFQTACPDKCPDIQEEISAFMTTLKHFGNAGVFFVDFWLCIIHRSR